MKVKLTDICTPKQWKTISTSQLQESGFPVYGANGVIGFYNEYNHENPTILITCRGATCGTINISQEKSYINGNAMCLDNLSSNVELKYLYYFLKAYDFKRIISGSAQPQIIRENLKKIILDVPDKGKQFKIISTLNKISELIALYAGLLNRLDILIKSRFIEMFGDPIGNEMCWKKVPLSFCIESIENGKSFVCQPEARQGDWPAILKLSAATYGFYRPDENKALLDESHFIERVAIKAGDLLFTRKNTPDLVGMCAYVYDTPPKLMMPDLIFRLNTTKICNKVFLWKLINHDSFRKRIQAIATGSAKSMSNISKERLLNIKIILPPLNLQESFEAFVAQVNKSKVKIQNSLAKLETLKKSLMQEYFA